MTAAPFASESPLNGLWVGEVQSDSGPQKIEMSIQMDGAHLGASLMSQGREIGVHDASVNGNTVTFVTFLGNTESGTKFNWTGVVNGDDISFTYSDDQQQNPPVEFVVHRQE